MNELEKKVATIKKTLILLPILMVAVFIMDLIYIHNFNNYEHTTQGLDSEQEVYFDVTARTESTSSWLKRDFDLNGHTVDLKAQTIDGNFYNNSKYPVDSWQLVINIDEDCFINNAWCGKMEIHQAVGTSDEKTQTLDLRDYNVDKVALDYLYDGDLLIPLYEGDYLIYYPSKEDNERPIKAGSSLTTGYIFYYLNMPTFSDYTLTYYYNRSITDCGLFHLLATLAVIWLIMFIVFITSNYTYKNALREMEIKKSGILCMSDIYNIIYIIDLKKNELTPVFADDASEKLRPKNMTAQEQLKGMFMYDCIDAYKDLMVEFSDLSNIQNRLENRSTVVSEYISKNFGWCRIRFFPMDRKEGEPLEKVVFTIQEINKEKEELEIASKQVDEAEMESKAKSAFLANMSHEIRTPINTVLGLDTMILRESKERTTLGYARDIKSAANMLLSLINGILDFSKLESGKMELVLSDYSLKRLLYDVRNMVKNRMEAKNLELIFNVSPEIPDMLYGDEVRLKQVLINIMTNAAKYTEEGSVTVSIFGKEHDGCEHLLVSVKDTGIGIREEDQAKLTERYTRFDGVKNKNVEGTGLGLNLVTGLLELMGSKLEVISKYGEGSEFYFEIEQKIVSDEKIGNLDFNDLAEYEDSEYMPSFLAPDATILVVDDNVLNLTVIKNLLKETKINIETADSGKQALQLCSQKAFDIIFMDHMMPEMDGVETFQKLREQAGGPNEKTPVIILTANALKGAKEEYLELGFTDFLPKPVQPDMLEEKIANYLDSSKLKKTGSKTKKPKAAELPVIDGIDVAYGLEHVGGLESLLTVLDQFATMADGNREELEGHFEELKANPSDEEAISNYRIKVHSMKSASGVMGAIAVSGMAAILEGAARNKNVQEIMDMSPHFFKEWTSLKDKIEEYINSTQPETEEEAKVIGKDELKEILDLLSKSMTVYDIKTSDELINKLGEFSFEDDKKEIMKQLKVAVTNLNAEEVTRLCQEFLN